MNDRILAAFWQPRSRRFCYLTNEELTARSGYMPGHPRVRELIKEGKIIRERIQGASNDEYVFCLSPAAQRLVTALADQGKLPQRPVKLTATPQEVKA